MTVSLEKKRLREEVLGEIQLLSDDSVAESDRAVCEVIFQLPELQNARRLFAYYSKAREVDTEAIISRARAAGKLVALPRIRGGGMDFAELDDLPDTFFGIPQPAAVAPALVPEPGDVVLVPGLCYDRDGYRLGWGGGYYDRLLADCRAVTVGLGREAFLRVHLPREAHDIPVPILVLDGGIVRFVPAHTDG